MHDRLARGRAHSSMAHFALPWSERHVASALSVHYVIVANAMEPLYRLRRRQVVAMVMTASRNPA